MALKITQGNTDDRKAFRSIVKDLKGKCFVDKGYIRQKLWADLWKQGLQLIHGIRKNMRHYLTPLKDKILLRKCFLVETIFGILKQNMNLDLPKHRSSINAFVHIFSALAAYAFRPRKPHVSQPFERP